MSAERPVVLAITGASGAIYAVRLLQVLAASNIDVHLSVSPSGAAVLKQELGISFDLASPTPASLLGYVASWSAGDAMTELVSAASSQSARVVCHRHDDFMTPIASGSFLTQAMVICPCSGTTLSGVARAAGANLVQRAAEVHLKERRKLVLVPRETPLSTIQLENMHRLSVAGAVILPAMPGWYHGVENLDSIVNFIVGRILDQLEVDNNLLQRWGSASTGQ